MMWMGLFQRVEIDDVATKQFLDKKAEGLSYDDNLKD